MLKSYGLHKNDPRLRPMMEKIYEIERQNEEIDNEAKVCIWWFLIAR